MKIAVVIPVRWSPGSWSVDPVRMIDGFQQCGHEAVLIARTGSEGPRGVCFQIATESELESRAFWSTLGLDLAVVFTWMRFPLVLSSMRAAGVVAVSRADTDGLIGVRVYPRATFTRMFYGPSTAVGRVRGAWHWGKKYAFIHKSEDQVTLASLAAADATIVETAAARANLLRFLQRYGSTAGLATRIHVAPHPVSNDVANCAIPLERARRVVAVGRWDDPQKNVRLLRRSLDRLLADDPVMEALVVGRGGDNHLGVIRDSRVTYLGEVPHSDLPDLLGSSRICLVTSRWEGSHQAAHEALCLGCSIVGTDLPVIHEFVSEGSGRLARGPRARHVAAAVEAEFRSWDAGERQPQAIADRWRDRSAPARVAASIIDVSRGAQFDSS